MRACIVIVTYNGRAWLAKSLGSCVRHAHGVPVYVVDNASTDGTAEAVRRDYPAVTLLPQAKNLGFAGGNNVGIASALAEGADAVLLLNQDAELTPGALPALDKHLAEHAEVGGVQPLILLPSGRVNSAGNSFHYLGFGEAAGNGLTADEAKERLPWLAQGSEPPYLSGAAVMLRASALRQVGLLHEELFMYHEDLELSLRLRGSGWKLALEPKAQVTHHYEHSRSLKQFYYMERNRLVVWNELFRMRTLLVLLPAFVFSELALLCMAALHGWLFEKLRSYAFFFLRSTWRSIAVRRRELAALKRVTDRGLLKYASARIEYHAAETGAMARYVFNPLSSLAWSIIKPVIRW